jgi:hypothetical protein
MQFGVLGPVQMSGPAGTEPPRPPDLARQLHWRPSWQFRSSISSRILVTNASVRATEIAGSRVVRSTSAIWP